MVHGVKTVNCAIKYDTRLQRKVKFRCHVWDGTPCRDKAVSLSLGLRYITNSICPILHAYLLQGYSVKAGHPPLLRSLVQIVTPSCWNVIIWWSLISFCKASQWNGMNMLKEIWQPLESYLDKISENSPMIPYFFARWWKIGLHKEWKIKVEKV